MRIWWQNVTSHTERPEYQEELTRICNSVAEPGTVVECHGTPTLGVGGEEYDPIRYLKVYGAEGILANAITAERQGYDAFTIGNTLDAGLREARALVNIPVVGHLQTALQMVSVMADSFSMIVSHYKFAAVWNRLIRDYGFKDKLISIDGLDISTTEYIKLNTDKHFEEVKLQRVVDLAKKAVASGAELLIIFPPPLCFGLARRGIVEIDGAPILNTTAAVIKMTELMVKFRQLTGTFVSRKLAYANPPRELVDQVIARHKLQIGA